ncbi:MAG: WbqC family protein [bacterium]
MIFQTAYLPPIVYMSEVLLSEEIIIEIHETYTKQTCRNRCSICGPNGKQILSIPVIKINGNHTLTKDIRISYHQAWQKIHWRSIETAYSNAPFFLYYRDYFYPLFLKSCDFLLDFNEGLLDAVLLSLKRNRPIRYTGSYDKDIDRESADSLVSKSSGSDNPEYRQVFHERHGFIPNLSIIDTIFNLGPETATYLETITVS